MAAEDLIDKIPDQLHEGITNFIDIIGIKFDDLGGRQLVGFVVRRTARGDVSGQTFPIEGDPGPRSRTSTSSQWSEKHAVGRHLSHRRADPHPAIVMLDA